MAGGNHGGGALEQGAGPRQNRRCPRSSAWARSSRGARDRKSPSSGRKYPGERERQSLSPGRAQRGRPLALFPKTAVHGNARPIFRPGRRPAFLTE
ncbi:hypothetical protein Salmuc_00243 [Salipiger mucosus DSM 16094]|uniref:Uncharacterized protein n=1 Tax=Salipiger mucosus DSM 16094 TaxID=1123237 RepID=S9S6T7_9RHOB|nr:hypothetical protein Salmuc_00243 [Salipiger mucosus DSM 16094]